jgi:hypothetical protein
LLFLFLLVVKITPPNNCLFNKYTKMYPYKV